MSNQQPVILKLIERLLCHPESTGLKSETVHFIGTNLGKPQSQMAVWSLFHLRSNI